MAFVNSSDRESTIPNMNCAFRTRTSKDSLDEIFRCKYLAGLIRRVCLDTHLKLTVLPSKLMMEISMAAVESIKLRQIIKCKLCR